MDREELDLDKAIDPDQLDVEAVRQAEVFYKWSERMIEARSKVERCKYEMDKIEAQLQLRVRDEPSKFGISVRMTEQVVEACVKTHAKYEAAAEALRQARRKLGRLESAVSAMEQRKRMIEILVTLHGQQYYAGPSVPRDLSSAYREFQERRTQSVNEKQKSKVRRRVRRKDE